MYRIFDVAIDSDIPLPELPEISSDERQREVIHFRCRERAGRENTHAWFHHWVTDSGTVTASCARVGAGFLLRIPGIADFAIKPSGMRIDCFPQEGVPQSSVRHALLDQVIPMLLGQLGRQVLHASAVTIAKHYFVAFVGPSGAGKSTLASSFAGAGSTLITDDCLMLEERNNLLIPIANYSGVRLYDDAAEHVFGVVGEPGSVAHYSNKKRIPLTGHLNEHSSPALKGVFLIDTATGGETEISIRPISGAMDLMPLVRQHFYLDVADRRTIATQFSHLQRLLALGVAVYHLGYPRQLALLGDVREAIAGVLSQ